MVMLKCKNLWAFLYFLKAIELSFLEFFSFSFFLCVFVLKFNKQVSDFLISLLGQYGYDQFDICSFKLYWQYLHGLSWWFNCISPEKVARFQFPTRISVVYNKLLPINDLVFQFFIQTSTYVL